VKIFEFDSFYLDKPEIYAIADSGEERSSIGNENTAVFDYDESGCILQVELLHLLLDWPDFNVRLVHESDLKSALRATFEEHLVFLQLLHRELRQVEGSVAAAYVVLYNKDEKPIGLKFYDFDEAHGPLSELNLLGIMPFQVQPLIRKWD